MAEGFCRKAPFIPLQFVVRLSEGNMHDTDRGVAHLHACCLLWLMPVCLYAMLCHSKPSRSQLGHNTDNPRKKVRTLRTPYEGS